MRLAKQMTTPINFKHWGGKALEILENFKESFLRGS